MRILILHSRYLSGDVSGENRVVRDEADLLSAAGHEVTLRQLSPTVDSIGGRVAAAARSIWARGVAAGLAQEVRRDRVDVVHVHNLFPELSPAVLPAAKRGGAAVVMTLHNYRAMCLPATLLRDGAPCEACVGRIPWRGVRHACYRGSTAGSAVLATSLAVHRAWGSFGAVDRYLAVSSFVRDKHIVAGLPAGKIGVKENFAGPAAARTGSGDHYLFLGRLAPEKGLDILLGAWRTDPGLAPLLVAGEGPERDRLAAEAPEGVRFLGSVPPDQVRSLIARARAVLVPSRWDEPAVPRAVLEAYAGGVGVVASAVGGIPEGVRDGESGLLVSPGDVSAWVAALRRVEIDDEAQRLGVGARATWRMRYAPDVGLRALEEAYAAVAR